MQPLRRQLDEDAWQRLNDYVSSVVQLVKDTNDTTEEQLLMENENLKRRLADQDRTAQGGTGPHKAGLCSGNGDESVWHRSQATKENGGNGGESHEA